MITQWLTPKTMEMVGEAMYLVSILASLAIAVRMFIVWRRWYVDIAGGLLIVCLLSAAYWLYCVLRIHLGCTTAEPSIAPYLCSELAWWVRIGVAAGLSGVAWWLWKTK